MPSNRDKPLARRDLAYRRVSVAYDYMRIARRDGIRSFRLARKLFGFLPSPGEMGKTVTVKDPRKIPAINSMRLQAAGYLWAAKRVVLL